MREEPQHRNRALNAVLAILSITAGFALLIDLGYRRLVADRPIGGWDKIEAGVAFYLIVWGALRWSKRVQTGDDTT